MDLNFMLQVAIFIAALILFAPGMIIVHEFGHYLGGKIDNLEFISFRFGNTVLARENGKLKFKNLETSQLGGQCIMAPKEGVTYNKAPLAYLSGGLIMNLIIGIIGLVLTLMLVRRPEATNVAVISITTVLAIVGLGSFIKNIIPIRAGLILSDGYLIKEVLTHPGKSGYGPIYTQLEFAKMNAEDISLLSADEELYKLPEDFDPSRPLHAQNATLTMNYLIGKDKVKEAVEIGEKILAANKGDKTFERGVHEYLYFEYMMGKYPNYQVDPEVLLDLIKYAEQQVGSPSLMRLSFAHYLLVKRNTPRAQMFKEQFLRACDMNYFQGEIQREKRLVSAVERRAATTQAVPFPVPGGEDFEAEVGE